MLIALGDLGEGSNTGEDKGGESGHTGGIRKRAAVCSSCNLMMFLCCREFKIENSRVYRMTASISPILSLSIILT